MWEIQRNILRVRSASVHARVEVGREERKQRREWSVLVAVHGELEAAEDYDKNVSIAFRLGRKGLGRAVRRKEVYELPET
jgi:hypothetical protein